MTALQVKNISPLAGYVVVEQTEMPEKTDSGIYLPSSVKEQDQHIGQVVAVSKEYVTESGEKVACPVKVGDTVLFKSSFQHDMEVEVEGKKVNVLRYASILATVK